MSSLRLSGPRVNISADVRKWLDSLGLHLEFKKNLFQSLCRIKFLVKANQVFVGKMMLSEIEIWLLGRVYLRLTKSYNECKFDCK